LHAERQWSKLALADAPDAQSALTFISAGCGEQITATSPLSTLALTRFDARFVAALCTRGST